MSKQNLNILNNLNSLRNDLVTKDFYYQRPWMNKQNVNILNNLNSLRKDQFALVFITINDNVTPSFHVYDTILQ